MATESTELKFVPYRQPDKQALTRFVEDMKGDDRTLTQYAHACGNISISTLSRILNGKITKPLPEDTLKALYENRRPESNVSYANLCRANGMIPEDRYKQIQSGTGRARMMSTVERESTIRNIIMNELFDRGIALRVMPLHLQRVERYKVSQGNVESRNLIPIRSDFAMVLPQLFDLQTWHFDVVVSSTEDDDESIRVNQARMAARRFLERRASVFLSDAWYPESLEGKKYSFVFTDEYVYDEVRRLLEDAPIKNAISTILVSLRDQKVVKEEWLNCEKKDDYESLFDRPVETYDEGEELNEMMMNYRSWPHDEDAEW